jgi:hypothetical protein
VPDSRATQPTFGFEERLGLVHPTVPAPIIRCILYRRLMRSTEGIFELPQLHRALFRFECKPFSEARKSR